MRFSSKLMHNSHWQTKVGYQRDWFWRGWRIRYSFHPQNSPEQNSRGAPIILLHGFGASLKHWRNNITVLSQAHPVYAIDLLGFGHSQKAYTNYGIELWSELLFDFWSDFIGQPSFLIGNSIGSLISLNTIVNYPHIAKGLVMLSLPDVAGRGEMVPSKLLPLVLTVENLVANPIVIRLLFYIARQPNVIRFALQRAYIDHRYVDEELVNFISGPPRDQGAARALIALTKSMNSFSTPVSKLLPQVNIPMLLIWGKSDRLVPPNSAEKLAQINPRINLQLLENIGHCPHDESPETFHNIWEKWLKVNF